MAETDEIVSPEWFLSDNATNHNSADAIDINDYENIYKRYIWVGT